MLQQRSWILPSTVPVEMPIGLTHVDSDSCWCEPLIETGEVGEKVVIHREVTWH